MGLERTIAKFTSNVKETRSTNDIPNLLVFMQMPVIPHVSGPPRNIHSCTRIIERETDILVKEHLDLLLVRIAETSFGHRDLITLFDLSASVSTKG